MDSNDLYSPGRDENKTDQWLGVTVKSQGPDGKVLVGILLVVCVCARYYASALIQG